MTDRASLTLDDVARALGGEVINNDSVIAPGPNHSCKDRSLSVRLIEAAPEGFLVHSFSDDDPMRCRDYVRERLGLPPWKPKTECPPGGKGGKGYAEPKELRRFKFDFCDKTGAFFYRKIRIEFDDGSKAIFFDKGGRNGSSPLLYGSERLADIDEGQPVWIVEGEKHVQRLHALGAIGVSGDTGHKSKFLPDHVEQLRGLPVILWPDSDEPGEIYIAYAAAAIRAEDPEADIRVVRPFGPPNGTKGKDICDWQGTAEGLIQLAAGASAYEERRDPSRGEATTRQEKTRASEPPPNLGENQPDIGRKRISTIKSWLGNRPAPSEDGFFRNGEVIERSFHENTRIAIKKLGVVLRQDEFANQPMIFGLPGYGPELTDAGAIRLWFRIAEEFFFSPTKELFEQVLLDEAHLNHFHPVRDYLAGLEWDRTPRIDNWLSFYGDAEDTPFNRAVSRIFLIAAIRRVRVPGTKFDTMPILESSVQGKNKSTALRILAKKEEWFSDSLPLGAETKEVIEQTSGIWIAEIAELIGIKTREEERIMAFLSRQVDKARLAYGRRPESISRQFVCCATTNEEEYLVRDQRRL